MPDTGRPLVFLLTAGLFAATAFSQTTGTIKGTLEDESGAVVPAANVVLSGNGTARTVQTQADGTFTFTGLAPGQYTAKIVIPGFAPVTDTVNVAAGATVPLPVKLSIQTEVQHVTVTAESNTTVSVEPDNNATALVIQGEDLQSLPDDPDDSGERPAGAGRTRRRARTEARFISTDSPADNSRPRRSIREVRINQNPFSAEYDRLGFGRIEILTKPGTGRSARHAVSSTTATPRSIRAIPSPPTSRITPIACMAAT